MVTLATSGSSGNRCNDRGFEQIIGDSSALDAVLEKVARVAPTESTVLLEGETGKSMSTMDTLRLRMSARSRLSARSGIDIQHFASTDLKK